MSESKTVKKRLDNSEASIHQRIHSEKGSEHSIALFGSIRCARRMKLLGSYQLLKLGQLAHGSKSRVALHFGSNVTGFGIGSAAFVAEFDGLTNGGHGLGRLIH